MFKSIGSIENCKEILAVGDYFYYIVYDSSMLYVCDRFNLKHNRMVSAHKHMISQLSRFGDRILTIDHNCNFILWDLDLRVLDRFKVDMYEIGCPVIIYEDKVYYVDRSSLSKLRVYNFNEKCDDQSIDIKDKIQFIHVIRNHLIVSCLRSLYTMNLDIGPSSLRKIDLGSASSGSKIYYVHVTNDRFYYKLSAFEDIYYCYNPFDTTKSITEFKINNISDRRVRILYIKNNFVICITEYFHELYIYKYGRKLSTRTFAIKPKIISIGDEFYCISGTNISKYCEFTWNILTYVSSGERLKLEPLILSLDTISIHHDIALLFARELLISRKN